MLQGQQYALRGARSAAFEEYERALTLAPDNPDVLQLQAVVLDADRTGSGGRGAQSSASGQ